MSLPTKRDTKIQPALDLFGLGISFFDKKTLLWLERWLSA